MPAQLRLLSDTQPDVARQADVLDDVFAALSDPVRRSILTQLDGSALLVSEIAQQFDISLQAVSKHIQVLVRAGLVKQERTGRISRCSLVIGPMFEAVVWLNRYSKYWQDQFDLLAATLHGLPQQDASAPASGRDKARGKVRGKSREKGRRGATKES
jgi:DNA-binding transcriptional ArsR family regulator